MPTRKHPPKSSAFAAGGGGTVFEHKVGAWYLVELLLGHLGTLGGPISAVIFQPDVEGPFDDLELQSEPIPGQTARAFVQIRHRQPLTSNNEAFRSLMRHVHRETCATPDPFPDLLRRYVLVLHFRSPGLANMQRLCRSARLHADSRSFVTEIKRSNRPLRDRLEQCRAAIEARVSDRQLHNTLRALTVRGLDLDAEDSDDVTRALADLAGMWQPPSIVSAQSLFDRLCAIVGERAPHGGTVDQDSLRSLISNLLGSPSSDSRRERLQEMARAARGRLKVG